MTGREPPRLGTCCLPWTAGHALDEGPFRRLVGELLCKFSRNLYIFGSAGEGYAVTDAQFGAITRIFVDAMAKGGGEPMVSVISPSVGTVVERIDLARRLGVRQFQVTLPFWGQCTFDEARSFFRDVLGRFPDCAFLHFNTPHAKRIVTPDEYAILSDEFPNLVATKNYTNSVFEIASLITKSPRLTHYFVDDGFALASLLGLRAGWIIAPASVNFDTANAFYDACRRKNVDEIAGFAIELADIFDAMLRIVGDDAHMNGAYDKLFARMAVAGFPLRLLPPYSGAPEEAFHSFADYIRTRHPRWAPSPSP